MTAPALIMGAPAPPSTIRVLVADDSAAIRTLTRHALSARLGFTVVAEATNGREALALFETHQPDCVVLDVAMPVMDGFEALAELRRRRPDVPVVMLSGFAGERDTERALSGGAAAYLDKASQLTSLGATVRRVTTPAARDRVRVGPAPQPVPQAATGPPRPTEAAVSGGPAAVGAEGAADLQRFEYVVSHDLAEPIRIMSGFATLLESRCADALDDSGRAYLRHIVTAAARGQAMIDDLLAFSRAGRREPQPRVVPLAEVVATACEQLAVLLRERCATVTSADLPSAQCDPELAATVVRELVENAITFTTSAAPQVHLGGSVVDGRAVLTVTDDGVGIAPADRIRVLDLFQRLHSRDEYSGTGTGLALCRRLTDLQGGTLVLTAAPGGGTTATLTLPAPPTPTGDPS